MTVSKRKPDFYVEQWGLKNGSSMKNNIVISEDALVRSLSYTISKECIKTHAIFHVYLKKQSS